KWARTIRPSPRPPALCKALTSAMLSAPPETATRTVTFCQRSGGQAAINFVGRESQRAAIEGERVRKLPGNSAWFERSSVPGGDHRCAAVPGLPLAYNAVERMSVEVCSDSATIRRYRGPDMGCG